MSDPDNHLYEFGPFRLDPTQRQLLCAEKHKRLSPLVFDLLLFLVQRSGQLVKKDEIIEHLWSDTIVEEGNLTNNVSILRKELGDTGKDPQYIQMVPKHGYRFVAEVKVLDAVAAKAETSTERREVALTGGSSDDKETHLSVPPHKTTRTFKVSLFAALILLLFLVEALNFWRSRTPAPVTPASIAVLPFKPLELQSSDPSLELGMTDSIIVKLSNIGQVTVLPLSAVRRFSVLVFVVFLAVCV